MRNIILSWATIHDHKDAWHQHLTLRKKVFVDRLGYNVPHTEKVEWDQYDNPTAHYSITLDESGKCIASARMCPTTVQNGRYSYMIKDASLGLLDGLKYRFLPGEQPATPLIWEATRFCADPTIGRREAIAAQKLTIDSMISYAQEQGIKCFLGLMPVTMLKLYRKLGFTVIEIGQSFETDGYATQAAIMPIHS